MAYESQASKDLDEINVVQFLKAIQINDPSLIEVSQSRFESLVEQYMNHDKAKSTVLEKRRDHYRDKIFLVKACLFILSIHVADREMMEVLNENGYQITQDTYFQDIERIMDEIGFEQMKLDEVENAMPKKPIKKRKDSEKINIFDILTSVSTGLELSLDFNKMVVTEFLSYKSALARKISKMEEQSKKLKNNKRHGK